MKTYKITKKDLNKDNEYIGNLDLSNLDGNLESEENLGTIKVKELNVKGYIKFLTSCGISAVYGIKAGLGILASYL